MNSTRRSRQLTGNESMKNKNAGPASGEMSSSLSAYQMLHQGNNNSLSAEQSAYNRRISSENTQHFGKGKQMRDSKAGKIGKKRNL